jgi:hypothetical protein
VESVRIFAQFRKRKTNKKDIKEISIQKCYKRILKQGYTSPPLGQYKIERFKK